VLKAWSAGRHRTGDLHARAMVLPPLLRLPTHKPEPRPQVRVGVLPTGYLNGYAARNACASVGKRLCKHEEFVTACRGESDQDFPYGKHYRHQSCNVFREAHPAHSLHGNPSIGHLDPRLNLVSEAGHPLLRRTGATASCASRWGDDAIYDMVGNLDEWIDAPKGAFAGGFYSRSTREGCAAVITVHPKPYFDYSLGVRCCRDASR
jgi:formylglycine-generating enzyme required for sulfatase activity